ncbi:cell division protein FtsZ, partial [bacterium]|nr:cell division protein FtsZ [bacterium]
MTELQMGLIGLGAISVLAVLAYNKWQENRHRKIAQRMMASQHTDILFDGIASSGTVHQDDA